MAWQLPSIPFLLFTLFFLLHFLLNPLLLPLCFPPHSLSSKITYSTSYMPPIHHDAHSSHDTERSWDFGHLHSLTELVATPPIKWKQYDFKTANASQKKKIHNVVCGGAAIFPVFLFGFDMFLFFNTGSSSSNDILNGMLGQDCVTVISIAFTESWLVQARSHTLQFVHHWRPLSSAVVLRPRFSTVQCLWQGWTTGYVSVSILVWASSISAVILGWCPPSPVSLWFPASFPSSGQPFSFLMRHFRFVFSGFVVTARWLYAVGKGLHLVSSSTYPGETAYGWRGA